MKKEEAARAVLKEIEPTQSMKDFAFRALSVDKQGPVWNSLQDDDEEMEEESEAGSGSSKEQKETPLQIALAKSLEQKLKTELATERARHREEMRETRRRLENHRRKKDGSRITDSGCTDACDQISGRRRHENSRRH